jgi:hypothetical protein
VREKPLSHIAQHAYTPSTARRGTLSALADDIYTRASHTLRWHHPPTLPATGAFILSVISRADCLSFDASLLLFCHGAVSFEHQKDARNAAAALRARGASLRAEAHRQAEAELDERRQRTHTAYVHCHIIYDLACRVAMPNRWPPRSPVKSPWYRSRRPTSLVTLSPRRPLCRAMGAGVARLRAETHPDVTQSSREFFYLQRKEVCQMSHTALTRRQCTPRWYGIRNSSP